MYQNGGGDVTKYKEMAHPNFVNYAKDGTHLVLLNGFELPIQPYVKKADQLKQGQPGQQPVNPQQQQQQQQQQAVPQQPTQGNPQQNAVSLYIFTYEQRVRCDRFCVAPLTFICKCAPTRVSTFNYW